jgi:zinc protease
MGCNPLVRFLFLLGISLSFFTVEAHPDTLIAPKGWTALRLPNGLDVLIEQDTSIPLATVQFGVRMGARFESVRNSGWSCLLSGLLTGPNRIFPGQDSFRRVLSQEGILYDHVLTPELTLFRLTALEEKMDPLIQYLSAAVFAPAFGAADIDQIRSRMLADAESEQSDPLFFLKSDLEQKLWGTEYHRRHPEGIPRSLLKADSSSLMEFRRHFFVPYQSVLIIQSPFTAEQVIQKVSSVWQRWHDIAPDLSITHPVPDAPVPDRTTLFITQQEYAKIPLFIAGWQSPIARFQDRYLYEMMTELLNHPRCPIQLALKDSLVCLQSKFQFTDEALYFTLLPQPIGNINAAVDSFLIGLRKLSDPGWLDSGMVSSVSTELKARLSRELESRNQRNQNLANYWYAGISETMGAEVLVLDSITPTLIQEVIYERLIKAPICMGGIFSSPMIHTYQVPSFFGSTPQMPDYVLLLDTLVADSSLNSWVGEVWEWLQWHPGKRIKIMISLPEQGWSLEARNTLSPQALEWFKQLFVQHPAAIGLRVRDISFQLTTDPEGWHPGSGNGSENVRFLCKISTPYAEDLP